MKKINFDDDMKKLFFRIILLCLFLCPIKLSAMNDYDVNTHLISRKIYEEKRQQIVERGDSKDYLVKLVTTGFIYTISLMGSILTDSNSTIPREAFQITNIASAIGAAYSIYNWAVAKTKAEGKCDRYSDNLGRYVPSKDEMDSGLYRESYENNGDFNGYKYNIPDDVIVLK